MKPQRNLICLGRLPALLCLLCALVVLLPTAQANCRRAYTGGSTHPTVNFGALKAPRDADVGTILATQMVDIDDANCDVLAGQTFNFWMSGTETALPNVYATNVGGVGVRVTPAADIGQTAYAPYVTSTLDSKNNFNQRKLKVELIKTGSIEAGKALTGQFYVGAASAPGFGSDAAFSGGSFQTVSCTTRNVSVTLPTISSSAFHGSNIAGTTPFSITIDCSGASMDMLDAIDYTLSNRTSVVDPANGAVALSPGSTSSGIALRISDANDLPVRFNEPVNLATFSRSQSNFSIPLKAAYFKTGTPGPGTVEAIVDFTLSYR
jgi:type 1 fimbria pilin